MKLPRWNGLAVILLGVGILVPCTGGVAQSARRNVGWIQDFETAESESQRLRRPLLIHFYADWCVPCRRMDRDVLNSPELGTQLKTNFVGVKVDADKHPELLKRYGVRSLPADVVVSADGKVLVQTRGYQPKRNYVARLESLGRRLRPIPNENSEPIVAGETVPARRENVIKPESPALEPLPGLDGYSPVSLYTWREWRKGKVEFTAYHKGIMYRLATEEELNDFTANPEKYVPCLLGCDPVILQKSDRAVPGKTKFGAYYDGKLYLFQSDETRTEFKKSPMRYIKTRHVLNADEIERGEVRQSAKPLDPTDPIRQ